MGKEASDLNALEEWKITRSKISDFDNNLHDLRKYGLTFITGLLAANSLQAYLNFGSLTKFFIAVITIAIITVLYILDIYYQKISDAASIRARILETTILNMELNETINHRFQTENLFNYIKAVYVGFITITVAIGVIIIAIAPSKSINSSISLLNIISSVEANLTLKQKSQHLFQNLCFFLFWF